ncbi:hypothetical protein [Aquimarina intermedia]|uniref:Uncharacterized protein n=1 Tax=Aquimarina intermedia TaxID=350814 RepID=A0A5S5BWY9_9FLAO|nr:hypothetical protein [Aquimarina intermedia]TYP71524.1 hypothetical protein BD809_109106 [Aquimarina intermedia]
MTSMEFSTHFYAVMIIYAVVFIVFIPIGINVYKGRKERKKDK